MMLTLLSFNVCGQSQQILTVFNDQVEAFNQGDIDRLVNNITDDFKWFYLSSDTLLLEVEGKEHFKKSMEGYFSTGQKVLSSIESYTITGNRISFNEMVRYKNKKGEMISSSAMGVYEIRDKKIYRAWYFID